MLHVHRTTVTRKLRFLAEQLRLEQGQLLSTLCSNQDRLAQVQFDEMETFEHTKLKPLSIAVAVSDSRYILGAEVARMPAKGLLAKRAVYKYGPRKDERSVALGKLLKNLNQVVREDVEFKSDENPRYPKAVSKIFPHSKHTVFKGLRGCVTGQGELKATPWDPLFSLNHTAAMLRANMNRLFRKTWCTTKVPQGLKDHLALYVHYHNTVLLKTA